MKEGNEDELVDIHEDFTGLVFRVLRRKLPRRSRRRPRTAPVILNFSVDKDYAVVVRGTAKTPDVAAELKARDREVVSNAPARDGLSKRAERLLAFVLAGVLLVGELVLAVAFPHPTPFQYTVFRVVLATSVSGIAAMIPGFLEVKLATWLRAGGALGVFVVVFFFNPAAFVVSPPDTQPTSESRDKQQPVPPHSPQPTAAGDS